MPMKSFFSTLAVIMALALPPWGLARMPPHRPASLTMRRLACGS
jgi:hypothetical protein